MLTHGDDAEAAFRRYQRRRKLITQSGGFSPSALSKVTAWLQNSAVSGDIASWTSKLDSNHATQSVAGRRPTANADGSVTFATNDAMAWILNAANNQTTKTGIRFWMKQPVSALEVLFCIYNGTGGASARKWFLQTNSARRVVVGAFISGNDGRQATTPVNSLPVAGTAAWVGMNYDSTGGGDTNIKIFINLVEVGSLTFANLGVGGTLTTLPAVTGNAVIGDLADGAAIVPFNGTMGKNIYIVNDALTLAEDTNLKNFQPLS